MTDVTPRTTWSWNRRTSVRAAPRSFDWSPDATRVCMGDSDGRVTIFPLSGILQWKEAVLHDGPVQSIRWSPVDDRLVSGGTDGRVLTIDATTAQGVVLPILEAFHPPDVPLEVAWSPDGKRLAFCGGSHGAVMEASTGLMLHPLRAFVMAWSRDGMSIAASEYGGTLRVWNAVTEIDSWNRSGDGALRAMAWDQEGRLAIAGKDAVRILGDQGDVLQSLIGHADVVHSVAWSSDDRLVVTASADRTVRIWSADTGSELTRLEHAGVVWQASFSPGDEWLMSACEDGCMRQWKLSDLISWPQAPPENLAHYAARQALTIGRGARAVQMRGQPALLTTLHGSEKNYARGGFASDGTIVSGHFDGKVRRWDVRKPEPIWSFNTEETSIAAIHSSPVNGSIAVAAHHSITIYDQERGQLQERIDHAADINDVRWASDHLALASASSDGRVIISRIVDDRPSITLRHQSSVYSVAWSPDDSRIASALRTKIDVWDVSTGNLEWSIPFPDDVVWCVRWSPDGQRIAAAHEKSLSAWDVSQPAVRVLSCGHGSPLASMEWSPDGRMIATTSFDRTIRLWDAATGKVLQWFTPEDGYHLSVSWSPDGTLLATCGPFDAISVWRVADAMTFVPGRRGSVQGYAITSALPQALAQLHRLQIHPPLSLLQSVLQLTGGQTPEQSSFERVARSEGVRALAALRWPLLARVGLAALLLNDIQIEGWDPPPGMQPAQVRDALISALAMADAVAPESPVVPSEAMIEAAGRVDDRLPTLLEIIGPKAVAQDPGLPLRLLSRLPQIRPLHFAQRQRLGLRTPIGSSGRASGGGLGGERGGFDLRGDLRALLPSQLVLPSEVVRFRHLRGELLYRAKLGQEPPQLRPTVLVLDVSPPSFGPIESVTRLAAHILGSTLLEAGIRAVLVTSGGNELVRVIERADDLVDIWTHRTREMADATRTFHIARAMREQIGGDGLEPIILVLSHAWFAAEEDLTAVSGLRGLFVQYPQHHVSPALARHCERWESLHPAESDRISNLLGKLLG